MSFRRNLRIFTIILLLSLLFTCRMDTGLGQTFPAAPAGLPADQILDVNRSYDGPFTYETVLPVALKLTVKLYRQASPGEALERQETASQLIIVSLRNAKGEQMYSGSIPSAGTLATVLSLPAAPQDVVLRLESPDYQTREVTIDGMVLYSEINRVMSLLSESQPSGDQALPDTDQDGVPDIYDVDPLDPEVAFQVRTPASGHFTVAFEDLYPVPGDADYNDFVANYFLLENYTSRAIIEEGDEKTIEQPIELILNLHGEATANDKVAGYSHKFGIVIGFPGYTALQVTRLYYDANGVQRTETRENVADKAVIWLFENTSKSVVGKTATFDIRFPNDLTRDNLSIAPYDPVLYVLNTGKDIHLVGRDSLTGQTLSYMDPNGYPWALLVPEEWKHPAECQYIGKAYPLFEEWRASKGTVAPYWYLYPVSTGSEPGNHPPYPVTASTANPELAAGSKSTQEFQLSLTDPKADPDGDAVDFMSSPAPMALQDRFSLNADTGLVTFQAGVPEGDYLFYFWSVDEHGASTIDKPFKVTFSFRIKASENQPPTVVFNDPPITGSAAIGGTLAASYSFSDPDGDLEGSSKFQWYRFTSSTAVSGGEAIAGATEKSYTTVDLSGNSDSGKWLRVQVIPVDLPGAEGTPVLSGPVRVYTRVVIDTFMPKDLYQNDTYLTLLDATGKVVTEDDNGNPDQANHNLCSRIDWQAGLPSGVLYYIKVNKLTDIGNPNYAIRLLDYDPGAVFPAVVGVSELSDNDNALGTDGLPLTPPVEISVAQVISRSIYPELTDNDWFTFTLP